MADEAKRATYENKKSDDIRSAFKPDESNPNLRRDAHGNIIPDVGNLAINDRHATVAAEMGVELDEFGNPIRAELDKKLPPNVPGKYFTDSKCIDCDMCREVAPKSFTRDSTEHMQSYVYKQPVTAEDITFAEEAIRACPVHAIGNDGETPIEEWIQKYHVTKK